jgi:mRNA-degrading endonuclease RelE of RelBE toxin-antitoxin system
MLSKGKTPVSMPIACVSFSGFKPSPEISGLKAPKNLAGYADHYRIRQGRYRIIYLIDDERREVTIFKIGHRRDVYR